MSIKADEKLTFIGKCAEEISLDHLNGSLQTLLIDEIVCCLLFIEDINDFNQTFLLLLFQLHIFLGVTEVGYTVACSQLCQIQNLPPLRVHV